MRNVTIPHYAAMLAPGETPATCARQLTPAQRNALIACALAGRLHRLLSAWHADGHSAIVQAATVDYLHKRGLLAISGRNARLTQNGKWYARTLCSALVADSALHQGVELCHTAN